MTQTVVHGITPDELLAAIRAIVQEEIKARFDRPVTRREVSELLGVSLGTVDNWIRKGRIRRINPEGARPKFSMNEVMNHKPNRP